MTHTRMQRTIPTKPQMIVLPLLMFTVVEPAALARGSGDDERRIVSHVTRLSDCPNVAVLGAEGGLLSLAPRGFLGVEASGLTPELRQHFGAPDDAGVMLSRVVEDSAAGAAGLRVGDIVTSVANEAITSPSRLGRVIRQQEGGSTVEIEYWRDGVAGQTTATLEERKRCAIDVGEYLQAFDLEQLTGLDLGEIDLSGIAIDHEAIQDAMTTVRDALQSQDWEAHLEGLKAIDLERIERRMERVQDRLERLEERLEREYGRDQARSERRRERDRERDRENGEGHPGDDAGEETF